MSHDKNSGTSTSRQSEASVSSQVPPIVSAAVSGSVNPSTTNLSTTNLTPPPTAPASTTEPSGAKKVNQTQSFIRHTPSAYNHFAYQQKIGKELAPHLIDESGMAPRFHLLDAQLFLDWVPEKGPSEEDRAKFKEAKLSESMSEHAMYPELVSIRIPTPLHRCAN